MNLNYDNLDSPSVWRRERQTPQLGRLFSLLIVFFAFLATRIASAQNPVPLWQYSPISTVLGSAYSPDGSLIAVSGFNGLQIFRVSDGTLIQNLPTINVSWVGSLAFSPDGSTFYDSGGALDGHFLESWNTSNWTLKNQVALTIQDPYNSFENPNSIAVSPDGKTIAVGGLLQDGLHSDQANGFVDLRSAADLSLLKRLPANSSSITIYDVQFSPDGTKLAASGDNFSGSSVQPVGSVQVFNVKLGSRSQDFTTAAQWNGCVSFSPDGTMLAYGGGGYDASSNSYFGTLEVRNLTSGTVTNLPTTMTNLTGVTFSPDGASLLVGGQYLSITNGFVQQGRADIWNLATGTSTQISTNANTEVRSVQYTANGKSFQLGGTSSGPAGSFGVEEIWNAVGLGLTQSLNLGYLSGANPTPNSGATSLTYAPSGNYMTYSGVNSQGQTTAGLINASSGAPYKIFPTTASFIGTTAMSSDGFTFADGGYTGSNPQSGVFELWNSNTGSLIASLPTTAYVINHVAFSPDGANVAGGGLNTSGIEIWNVSTRNLSSTLPTAGTVHSLAYSSNGRMIVDGGSAITGETQTGMVELWNLSSRQRTSFATTCSVVNVVAISPDGTQVADAGQTPSGGYVIEVWNVQTGASITNYPIQSCIPSSMTFMPDGGTLFVSTSGGVYVIGAGLGNFEYSDGLLGTLPTTSLCLSPDGQFIGVAGGSAGMNQSWIGLLSNPLYSPYKILGLTINPTAVTGGSSATGTVTISQPAPAGGFSLGIGTSPTNPVFPPATVLIPAGQTSATFTITTAAVTAQVVSTIGAYNLNDSMLATLTVNPPQISNISLTPGTVVGGNTSTGTVTLNGPAPDSGLTVTLTSNSPNAAVPSTVTVSGGSTTATFTATTTGVSASTSAKITATSGGATGSVQLNINPASLASLTFNPLSVVGGGVGTGTVTLNGSAPTGGTVITLKAMKAVSGVTFPTSVTIFAGSNSANFSVTTQPVSTQSSITIVASVGGQTGTSSLTILVATLQGIRIQPNSIVGGQSTSGTIYMTGPVTSTVVVKLTSSSSVVGVPASVTITKGNYLVNFNIRSTGVKAVQTVSIIAKIGNQISSAQLTVSPSYLDSIKINPTTVVGGSEATGTVVLVGNAPTGGVVLTLTSNTSCASTPSTVSIAAGRNSATFTVKTIPVSSSQNASIAATLGGSKASATLTVTPPVLKSLTLSSTSVNGGQSVTATITLGSAAPTGGATISISSSSPLLVPPTTVTIPAGQTLGRFTCRTLTTTQRQTATAIASYAGVSKSASITIQKP